MPGDLAEVEVDLRIVAGFDFAIRPDDEELRARETRRDTFTVYPRPELVVEIAFNDLQASPRYPGGIALRFARVKRYRPDKTVTEADTIDTVRAIYEGQLARGEAV